jgi:hypothetical protein
LLDERARDKLDLSFGRIIRFFKGGLTYQDLENMPIPRIFKWIDIANKINKEEERANGKI